MAEKAFNS